MSGELCIAIRLMRPLAIPLGCQRTTTKWLVIGCQNTAAKSLVKPDLHLVSARPAWGNVKRKVIRAESPAAAARSAAASPAIPPASPPAFRLEHRLAR